MLTHKQVWSAIDNLAESNDLTTSGLARRAGLDPTTFNKSKRNAPDGRPRWPSTESLSKIMDATDTSLDNFTSLLRANSFGLDDPLPNVQPVPLIGFAQAGVGGFFDDGGFPVGQGWDEVHLPSQEDDSVYALEVSGDSMLPLYRDGDIIIVSPNSAVRRGDRVVVKSKEGEVMAKVLYRKTAKTIELVSVNPEHKNRTFDVRELEWIARIIWASQ
jgi:phage repressor protein C with HTH and peptisase S24 domain